MSIDDDRSVGRDGPATTDAPDVAGSAGPAEDAVRWPFLASGGQLGAMIAALEWADTALGPISGWPQSLRTAVGICLRSRFPMLLWWGPELVMLYNDAYQPILGASKHPGALSAAGESVWPEIWNVIGPMLVSVRDRGEATWSQDQLLALDHDPDGRRLLRLRGELDLASIGPVRAALLEHLRVGDDPVILDTAGLSYLSSAGVGLLIEAAGLGGGRVVLRTRRGSPTARILALTGLDQQLPAAELPA